jgi:hypothetical protein
VGIAPAPVPPDGDPAETRRALIQTRFAYNRIFDALERTKAELAALKAANGAASPAPASVEAFAAAAAPATVDVPSAPAPRPVAAPEPDAKSVPAVPDEQKREANQPSKAEPAGSNPVPPSFQDVPAPAVSGPAEPTLPRRTPPAILKRVARSEAARMAYCSRR